MLCSCGTRIPCKKQKTSYNAVFSTFLPYLSHSPNTLVYRTRSRYPSHEIHLVCLHLSDLVDCLDGILTTLLEDSIQVWAVQSHSEHTQVHTLLDKVDAASDQPVPVELRATTSLKTPTLYIFTSGTTGKCGGVRIQSKNKMMSCDHDETNIITVIVTHSASNPS